VLLAMKGLLQNLHQKLVTVTVRPKVLFLLAYDLL
jgi:hypothetical protein